VKTARMFGRHFAHSLLRVGAAPARRSPVVGVSA